MTGNRGTATQTAKLGVSGSDAQATFDTLVTALYLIADTDTFVDFDRTATTSSFLLKANQYYPMEEVPCTQVHAITSGGTGSLYIVGVRA